MLDFLHIFRGYRVLRVSYISAEYPGGTTIAYIPQLRQPFSEIIRTNTIWVGIDKWMPRNCIWVKEIDQLMHSACNSEDEAYMVLSKRVYIGNGKLYVLLTPLTTRKYK